MEQDAASFSLVKKGAVCEAKTGPIEARAEPGACGRCKFMCSGPENIPFWRQTVLLRQKMLANPHLTRIMREESEKFLATANNILNRHSADSAGTPSQEASDV